MVSGTVSANDNGRNHAAVLCDLSKKNWRRRPDLNRGWRFCRPYRVVDRSAWLRLLVPDDARFSLVFGRCCSEVAPNLQTHACALTWLQPHVGDRQGGRPLESSRPCADSVRPPRDAATVSKFTLARAPPGSRPWRPGLPLVAPAGGAHRGVLETISRNRPDVASNSEYYRRMTLPTDRRTFLAASASAVIGLSLRSSLAQAADPATLTLTRASELLRAKAVSSVELTRACLARIERFNGPLNAFITVTADQALTTARDMDAALRRIRDVWSVLATALYEMSELMLGAERPCVGRGVGHVLTFGSDLRNYSRNHGLKVFKPRCDALERIVNYRHRTRAEAATAMVSVGGVRYASSHRAFQQLDGLPVSITTTHLPGQKTALFGMTRTGKSNTAKIVLKTIFELRWQPAALRIGQGIFDPNGEYANENAQDAGER